MDQFLKLWKKPSRSGTMNLGDAEMKCQALYIQYYEKGCMVSLFGLSSVGASEKEQHSCLEPILQFHCSWHGLGSPFPTTPAAGGLKGLWQQLGITSTEREFRIHSFLSWATMTLKSSSVKEITATHYALRNSWWKGPASMLRLKHLSDPTNSPQYFKLFFKLIIVTGLWHLKH